MPRNKYHKLVRDKILKRLERKGVAYKSHVAVSEEEYWQKLKEKLQEEVDEFLKVESKEELADILEVIDAIIEAREFSKKDVQTAKKEKTKERGAFEKKIILDEAD